MTLYDLIHKLKDIALRLPNVRTFAEGSVYDVMNGKNDIEYDCIVLSQDTHRADESFNYFTFNIFYISRLVSDMEENRLQVQSLGIEVLNNLFNILSDKYDIEIENNIQYNPFTQKFVDECCGVYASLVLNVPKEFLCAEQLFSDNSAPIISIKNVTISKEYTKNGDYNITYDKLNYTGIERVEVKVAVDYTDELNSAREEGYNQGNAEGYAKGTQDGYDNGYAIGEEVGYNNGLEVGKEEGVAKAGEIIAETAQVLNITENGLYATQFTKDEDIPNPEIVTGVFDDNTEFYNYAQIRKNVYNTGIVPTADTVMEIWWRSSVNTVYGNGELIGSQKEFRINGIYKLCVDSKNNFNFEYNGQANRFSVEDGVFNHFYFSKENGIWINGEYIMPIEGTFANNPAPIYINGIKAEEDRQLAGLYNGGVGGDFGMIKIDGITFIPTENGWLNVNTNEYLPIVTDYSDYEYVKGKLEPLKEGNLIRTINVDVKPKINVSESGIKFSYSTFSKVPEYIDFEGVTDFSQMFSNNQNLKDVPPMVLSVGADVEGCFLNCTSLIDLSFMETWTYPINLDMSNMFGSISNIQKCPALYIEGNSTYYQSYPFWAYSDLIKFTDFGGFVGLKYSMTREYQLPKCPNLSYESCINILNGLYDFVGNNETPNSNQGQLRVHSNFLELVGEEINIAVQKGWQVFN